MDHPRSLIEFMELYPTEDSLCEGNLRAPLAGRLHLCALRQQACLVPAAPRPV